MLKKDEVDQWWEELGISCSEEFVSCIDDIIDDDICEGLCKDFCKNVIESFEDWKDKKGDENVDNRT